MRRGWLRLGIGALVGLAVLFLLFSRPSSGEGITEQNYERIQLDMTEPEIEAILGCPAGNYSGKDPGHLNQIFDLLELAASHDTSHSHFARLWVGEEVAVLVSFDAGKARFHQLESVENQHVSWLNRVLPRRLTAELVAKAFLVCFIVWVFWYILRPRYLFEIQLEGGHPCVRRGKVTAAFLGQVGDACQAGGVTEGWIVGVRDGRFSRLRFSSRMPRGVQQQLRNQWPGLC
jgi:hypothetical protein